MTARKERPAKRGRKVAPPGAKLRQMTIRLPPTLQLGLHMLARARGLSLSQAIEHAVLRMLQTEKIDGERIIDLARNAKTADGKTLAPASAQEAMAEDVLRSPGALIMHMPAALRTPEERYFAECVGIAGPQYVDSRDLLAEAREGFKQGVSPAAVVEVFLMLYREASS